jgi:hypothetical protein
MRALDTLRQRLVERFDDVMLLALVVVGIPAAVVVIGAPFALVVWIVRVFVPVG